MNRPPGQAAPYDLCIVGAGPAGVVLAREFTARNPTGTVLLLEYGASDASADDLDATVRVVTPDAHHPPRECTDKGFGGTSRSWGGRCVMYDRVDFVDRPVLQGNCTWDESFLDSVLPFLACAAEHLECGGDTFDLAEIYGPDVVPIAEGFKPGYLFDTRVERYSRPTRFRSDRVAFEDHPRITLREGVVIHGLEREGTRVSAVRGTDRTTGSFVTFRAASFVLAAGAQETTRLLLKSPRVFPWGTPAALGRYYQGHASGKIASIVFTGDPQKTEYGFRRDNNAYIRRRIQFRDDYLIENDRLNIAFWLDNGDYSDAGLRNGPMSFMYLALIAPWLGRRLAPAAMRYTITRGLRRDVRRHVLNVLCQLPTSLTIPFSIFLRRFLPRRPLPGVFLFNPRNRYALHYHCEQIPRIDNRMELSDDGRELRIALGICDEEVDSIRAAHDDLDRYLRSTGVGRLEYHQDASSRRDAVRGNFRDGIHQCGTTRIANSSGDGVVDPDLRVFGLDNLYVCSSSVFPTSGQANPTFLLCVLAVRLASHLSSGGRTERTPPELQPRDWWASREPLPLSQHSPRKRMGRSRTSRSDPRMIDERPPLAQSRSQAAPSRTIPNMNLRTDQEPTSNDANHARDAVRHQ